MAKKPKSIKSDKPEPEKWLDKISRAKRVKKAWREQFQVGKCYDYYEGRQKPSGEEDYFIVNRIFSSLQAELPTLYGTDPYFYVKLGTTYSVNPAEVAQFEKKATVRQSMLNYLKTELKLKQKARLSIFDAQFQFGILKVYYSATMIENPDAGKPIMIEGTEIPMIGDDGQPLMEPDSIPANEAYKVCRIHPDDFIVDADAGPLNDEVNWKAHRIKMLLDDLKKDKRYKKSAIDKVTPTELSDEAQEERERRKKGTAISDKSDDEPDTCVLWEIYDLKNDQMCVVAEGLNNEFLIDPMSPPPGIEKDPFSDLRFITRDASWYPIPPVSQLLDAQRATNDIRTKMVQHRKRFNRKYEVYAPAFDDPEASATKLEDGDDGTVLLKNQPQNSVTPIQDAPLDQMHIMELNFLNQDFQELAVGSNQKGAGTGVDSATEAGIIEKRTQMREGDKIGMVMDFITEVGRKIDQVVQANITKDQAVKVSGGPDGEYWALVKTQDYEDIAGEYQYSINVGATTPQLPEIERAQWMAFLGLIAQAPQLALSPSLMKKMAELHHIYDENMIKELGQIAQQIMSGQMPMPGQQGSQPNVMQQNPQAIGPGAAAGINNIRGGIQ
ncbi:MAG: hypothetical protein ABIJ12_14230 [bacterium]